MARRRAQVEVGVFHVKRFVDGAGDAIVSEAVEARAAPHSHGVEILSECDGDRAGSNVPLHPHAHSQDPRTRGLLPGYRAHRTLETPGAPPDSQPPATNQKSLT